MNYNYAMNGGISWMDPAAWMKALTGGEAQRALTARVEAHKITAEIYTLDGPYYNPSMVVHDGRLRAILRTSDGQNSGNVLGEIVGRKLVHQKIIQDNDAGRAHRGYEDCRLFVLNGRLMALATIGGIQTVGASRPDVCLVDLEAPGGATHQIQSTGQPEKNWMPVVDTIDGSDRFRVICAVDPLVVRTYDFGKQSFSDAPRSAGVIRGGSPLIPYNGGWLCIVHQVHTGEAAKKLNDRNIVYTHRFVRFDHELTQAETSAPFFFQREGIEFAAGLVEWEGHFLVSFGDDDKRACIAEIERGTIVALFSAFSSLIQAAVHPIRDTVVRAAGEVNKSNISHILDKDVRHEARVWRAWQSLLGFHQ
jgi:hypothetical protein